MSNTSETSEPKNDDSDHQEEDVREAVTKNLEPLPDKLTVYSSKSDIRSPLKLFKGIIQDCFAGRDLAWRLFLRNLRGMYRQTLLGLFWAFLPPIANTAIWIFLKSQNVFKMEDTGIDSTVYILTGMILWQAFVEAFQMPLNALNKNKGMLSKLRFPREALIMVGLAEVLFNLGIRMLLLIPAFWWFNVPASFSMLLAIPAIIGLILLACGMGLVIMPIGSLYQDVGRFINMVMPFWMIVTPIIYVPFLKYPGTLLNWVNPASPLLILSRDLLLMGTSNHLYFGLIFGAASVPLVLIGVVVYRVSLPVLIERMTA